MSDFWNSQRPAGDREKCYVGVIRLSHMRDNTSSPERQELIILEEAKRRGGKVVAWAVDLDVSGAVSPFDRPEFGKWLTDSPPKQFDGFIAWKVDRFARSIMDFHELLKWAKERDKEVISAAENFDLFSTVGQIIVAVLAGLAQMEREAIAERIANAREYLRYSGRYGYGTVPYGFKPVAREGGGYVLDKDESQVAVLVEIATRLRDDESRYSIAKGLNERGELPPALAREKRSQEVAAILGRPLPRHKVSERHRGWSAVSIERMMRSPALRGYVTYDFKYTDPNGVKQLEARALVYPPGHEKAGEFVRRGPEILTASEQQEVIDVMDAKKRGHVNTRRKGVRLLYDLLFCGVCDARMVSGEAGAGRHRTRVYRCSLAALPGASKHKIVAVTSRYVEEWVEAQFLAGFGRLEVVEVINDPGEDHSAEIAEVKKALKRLRDDRYVHNLFEGDEDAEQDYLSRYRDLRERQKYLEGLPFRPAGENRVHTGQSVAERWAELDEVGRRDLLVQHNVKVTVQPHTKAERRFDPERLQMFVNDEPLLYAVGA
ncbi:recombinase family protein [Crossiella sp. CA198]|uniref:recombinase family protein n=1 Tax=Crossiella sp. CA198 TaxID=3455607 RepID=UPI003F8D8112